MANAAWAFVRPSDITNGALAAVKAQNSEDANALALAERQSALDYNTQLRPIQLQQQQDAAAYNQQIRPLQLQQAQDAAAYNQQIRPIQLQQAQQGAALNTLGFEDKSANMAITNALTVPQLPGESELDLYKKQLAIAMTMEGTNRAKALDLVQQNGVRLRVAAAEKGDPQTAQELLYEMNKFSPAFLSSLPPAQQMGVLTDKQLTYSIPKPADTAMLKHITPSGDAILKGKLDAAESAAGLSEAKIQKEYLSYLADQAKAGMGAMPYTQYRDAIVRTSGTTPNSVASRATSIGPSGVPYK
jgi:hypothetical protein